MQKNEKRRRKMVHNLQMGLWVALILVQMAVVNCLEVRAENAAGNIVAKETADGVETILRQVERDVVYERVEGGASLPETLDVQVKAEGQTVMAVCAMEDRTVLRERWEEGFSFPVTFHTYDAEYYQLGDRRIPCNEEHPELDGCEAELLELIGVSPEEYRITSMQWAGEPYEGADGELCRDALGSGEKLVRDYRVHYVGTAQVPVRREVQAQTESAVEEPTEPESEGTEATETAETIQPEVSIQAEPDAPAQPQPEGLTLWQRITRTLLVVIGIGALLFFGGLLVLAFLWVVKKVRKWYTEHKRTK